MERRIGVGGGGREDEVNGLEAANPIGPFLGALISCETRHGSMAILNDHHLPDFLRQI